ncbi:MAG: 50S ribosomal protein L9 [bacterium]|uniref:Large ribosomal subunit protein bL9 n=2 Tax=Bacteria candidate phyla TaxID=1783234 RepID=A0A101I0J0_UNCT6|nr:MAG: 50S ribosomal protein L9 [candidate division TA06 bacterium 32_111]KUK86224.1 MAG: 50S ribosomal protein L9 [candidate division TA06 bacterium 34_109]MDI6700414.1 50S ribosomal protein L9 [bacterium]HAF08226.1 50S ribosomal protein L9 [candidate division WOR-3 bacterium]HCP16789.1 50S ribosomal protein L9 [candidate division WOR-3 bacterium]
MKIILRENIEKLGKRGDVVNVKDGYARNYLIPNKIAYEYSENNLKRFQQEKIKYEQKELKNKEIALQVKEKLSSINLTIKQKVHDDDSLYGSISKRLICEELEKNGIKTDENAVLLDEPIKKLGDFEVNIKLHPEVIGVLKLSVVKDE